MKAIGSILVVPYWIAVFLILWTWIIYLSFLIFLRLFKGRLAAKRDFSYVAKVSFIIAAHNEENHIGSRINNLLELDYPRHLIEIIIGSDGSTDRTDQVVTEQFGKYENVRYITFAEQKGRAHVHNEAMKIAAGDIVVFSDAETEFAEDFLRAVIPHFASPTVGCVSGRIYYKNVKDTSITQSADIYWRYEERMRCLESDLGMLTTGTGAALAIRKDVYRPIGMSEDVDRVIPLEAAMRGWGVKYEPDARAYDVIEGDIREAQIARIRKTSRAFADVMSRLLRTNPFRRPLLSMSIFSHKTSRHLTPYYMIFVFLTNAFLLHRGDIYWALFFFQIVFYVLACIGWFLEKRGRGFFLFYIPYNFVLLNTGRFIGVLRSILGFKVTTYQRGGFN